jgi:hypothetical protein
MACGGVLLLAGCGGDSLSRAFGLTHVGPDEFTVTTRAPLSMPPDYSLRPPEPGAARPQEEAQSRSAEATLSPESILTQPAPGGVPSSPGQDALMAAAGHAPSDIRARVNADAAHEGDSQALADKLLFWKTPTPPGDLVDAQQESERLKDQAALGSTAPAGDVPVIRRKSRSVFDTLF